MAESVGAEISRLRAYAIRIAPIVRTALELRELGRALDFLESQLANQQDDGTTTRCGTPWMMTKQAYDTALERFDTAVKDAALQQFADLWQEPPHD